MSLKRKDIVQGDLVKKQVKTTCQVEQFPYVEQESEFQFIRLLN